MEWVFNDAKLWKILNKFLFQIMSAVQFVNSKAEVLRKYQALAMNINAAAGLMEVMKSNIGPKGTLKMLVGGAG